MANGSAKLSALMFTIIGSLAAWGVIGTVRMGNAQSAAEAKQENLEQRIELQERAINSGLDKIDVKLEKITDILTEQAIQAAKSHHSHRDKNR